MDETHFDAVVIGSGFGGSVMTYRLAEAGLRTCLLERGKPYPPNSFARAPYKMKTNFWDPSKGLYGLFNVWSFKGSGALVSSGLGGGSLVYANVLLRKDEKWFVHEDLKNGGYEYWPVTRADLDPHYERAEKMLNAQRYPFNHPPYDQTPKTRAMREAAATAGLEWGLPNIAVSFRSRPVDQLNPDDASNPPRVGEPIEEMPGHENLHGMTRQTCRLCGECDIGCNYGSKNTLDFNYLSEAKHLHAEIRTLCEVRTFAPRAGGGYTVNYVQHDLAREGTDYDTTLLPLKQLTCDRLIISAGTFGSPYLLMKNRSAFPLLSDKLGTRFSVNGDLLSFFVRTHEKKNGQLVPRIIDPSFGPVITSFVRVGDSLDGMGEQGRGFYVQEGGNPNFLNWLADTPSSIPGSLKRLIDFGKHSLEQFLGLHPNADIGSLLSDLMGPLDVTKSSMPVLTMGRDVPSGVMTLNGKFLDVDWNDVDSADYYKRVNGVLDRLADALNGEHKSSLAYKFLHQVLTAHPLGGCPMGRDKSEGVVNSVGEVFDYPGLYVLDGSIMPGPVGPNPSLTIAALSDRSADHVISQHQKVKP